MVNEIKMGRKKLIADPIKSISLNDGGGGAREIVIQIATALGFKIHEDELGVSAYGGNTIRIADHCTFMQTWVDYGTWNSPVRLDVVIEDSPTQPKTQVTNGYNFTITEFVHNSSNIDPQSARMIAYDIRNVLNGNQYANNVRGEKRILKSTSTTSESILRTKKLFRLTESDLHRIIKKSVKRILNESWPPNEYLSQNEYEVSFTFYISLGENQPEYKRSILEKDRLLDMLDRRPQIVNYDVEKDDEDWCINCIANITAKNIKVVDRKMEKLLEPIYTTWDYHYIKGLNTDEYWQP